jgi:hypothetical protein
MVRSLLFVAFFASAVAFAQDTGPATFHYVSLSPAQKALFAKYVSAHAGARGSDQDYWENTLNTGEPTTFAAVTHAMEHTQVGSGTLLDYVDSVTTIQGDIPSNPSAEQFNLAVVWKSGVVQSLEAVGYSYRIGSGHDGEWGLSYASGSTGLHLLFANDGSANGHAHVDYRQFTLGDILGGGEGHMKPYGADVRQIGPETDDSGTPINNLDHHQSWFGELAGFERLQ